MAIREKIRVAYQMLLEKDAHLLTADANERSITHKFADYLQQEFPDYDVDCEYNRNGLSIKRLDSIKRRIESSDTKGITVFPDIIVHHRGTADNFIVIEAKKTTNGENGDLDKLSAYKDDLKYQHAFFVWFPVKDDFNNFHSTQIDDYIQEIENDE